MFGVFVIEADGERAGVMRFSSRGGPNRIAELGGLAVHPDHRGRKLADEAARLFQRHLFEELGFHRLQLEVYGFNERAMRHAERSGFVLEGRKRRAYLRDGEWVDGVIYGLTVEDLPTPLERRRRVAEQRDAGGARLLALRLGEVLGGRLPVDAGEHEAADEAEHVRHVLYRPVGVEEGTSARLVALASLRPVDRLQQQVVEQEREVERRVAAVDDLPVDHPETVVADEDVLRRVVAVDDASRRVEEPLDVGADPLGELGMPPLDRAQIRVDALRLERLGAADVAVGRVQHGEQRAKPRRDARVGRSLEQQRLPRPPVRRRLLHDERERVGIGVEEPGHGARR